MLECKEIRSLLADYAAGILDEETAAKVADHLLLCPICAGELERLGQPAEEAPAPVQPAEARSFATEDPLAAQKAAAPAAAPKKKLRRRTKVLLVVLALLLVLVGICTLRPQVQPLEQAQMATAKIQLRQGKIENVNIFTTYCGKETKHYRYIRENGIEALRAEDPETGIDLKQLTYGEFSALLETVLVQMNKDGMGLADCEQGEREIQYPISAKNNDIREMVPGEGSGYLRYRGYYLYSLNNKKLLKGDGAKVGRDALGGLQITNQWMDSRQGTIDYIYVLIAD